MAFRFPLRAASLAHYNWGSLLPRFSARAPLTTRSLPEFVSQMNQEVGVWKTEAQFRGFIAFHHEVVHYLQDLTTGIGHWDYLIQRQRVPQVLGEGLWSKFGLKHTITEKSLAKELLYVPTSKLPRKRRAMLLANLRKLAPKLKRGEETPYSIESLLEAEAAVTVDLQWRRFKKSTEAGWGIADQNRHIFDPWKMPEGYRALVEEFAMITLQPIVHRFENEPVLFEAAMMLHNLTFILLSDIACAHPPPFMFKDHGLSQAEYEPGLRFARLARAYSMMPDELEPWRSLVWSSDVEGIERHLKPYMNYDYISYGEINKAWVSVLRKLSEESDDRLLKLRCKAALVRAERPNSLLNKTLASFIDHGLRLPLCTAPGFIGYGFTPEDLDPDEDKIFFVDLMRLNRDAALADYFLKTGPFICPLAETGSCQIPIAVCSEGMKSISELPDSPHCAVRCSLKESNFSLN
jgi:hypothetical protein